MIFWVYSISISGQTKWLQNGWVRINMITTKSKYGERSLFLDGIAGFNPPVIVPAFQFSMEISSPILILLAGRITGIGPINPWKIPYEIPIQQKTPYIFVSSQQFLFNPQFFFIQSPIFRESPSLELTSLSYPSYLLNPFGIFHISPQFSILIQINPIDSRKFHLIPLIPKISNKYVKVMFKIPKFPYYFQIFHINPNKSHWLQKISY